MYQGNSLRTESRRYISQPATGFILSFTEETTVMKEL